MFLYVNLLHLIFMWTWNIAFHLIHVPPNKCQVSKKDALWITSSHGAKNIWEIFWEIVKLLILNSKDNFF